MFGLEDAEEVAEEEDGEVDIGEDVEEIGEDVEVVEEIGDGEFLQEDGDVEGEFLSEDGDVEDAEEDVVDVVDGDFIYLNI